MVFGYRIKLIKNTSISLAVISMIKNQNLWECNFYVLGATILKYFERRENSGGTKH